MSHKSEESILALIRAHLGVGTTIEEEVVRQSLLDINSGKIEKQNEFVFVNDKSDLPEEDINGIITLGVDTTYYLTKEIDLLGCRLSSNSKVILIGADSETVRLRSTGLAPGESILTATDTVQIRDITITSDVNTFCLDLDGTTAASGEPVGDWFGCNFEGNIGRVKNFNNLICISTAWFPDGSGLLVEGSIGTIAFENSIFVQFTPGEAAVEFASDYVATRRIRFGNSAFVIGASSEGINLPPTTTVPVESFILNLVNFSGGGSYVVGTDSTENRSRFIECRGVANSANIGEAFSSNNASPTVITAINTPVKAVLNATATPEIQRFIFSADTLEYAGALNLPFSVQVAGTVTSGNNNQVLIEVYKNGAPLPSGAKVKATTGGAGRAEGVSLSFTTQLTPTDILEVYVSNLTAIQNITFEDFRIVVHEL